MEEIGWVVLAFFLGGLQTLLACALGGYLVFRTKREPHESFFENKPAQGEVGSLDEVMGPGEDEDVVPQLFAEFEQRNAEFLKQTQQESAHG